MKSQLRALSQKVSRMSSNNDPNLDAGGGLVYADYREQYQDRVNQVEQDSASLKESVAFLAKRMTSLEERDAATEGKMDALLCRAWNKSSSQRTRGRADVARLHCFPEQRNM